MSQHPQSEYLTQFYQAYAAWLDAGAPNNDVEEGMSRYYGLCSNLFWYCRRSSLLDSAIDVTEMELRSQFRNAPSGEVTLPFNRYEDAMSAYHDEKNMGLCHTNTRRVQWVRDHCNAPV